MQLKEYRDNANRHLPPYLRDGTKTNIIWQLKLSAVLLVVLIAKEEIETRRETKKRKARSAESTEN